MQEEEMIPVFFRAPVRLSDRLHARRDSMNPKPSKQAFLCYVLDKGLEKLKEEEHVRIQE